MLKLTNWMNERKGEVNENNKLDNEQQAITNN